MQTLFRHFIALLFALAAIDAAAQITDPLEQRIISWVDANGDDAIELLAKTVNISSGTMNHAGVRAVGRGFPALRNAGQQFWKIDAQPVGDAGQPFSRV